VSFIVSPQELPNKKPLTSEERKRYLEKYLNDLSSHPEVIQSKAYLNFIEKPKNGKIKMEENISIRASKKYF
jgi:hypothetical protein